MISKGISTWNSAPNWIKELANRLTESIPEGLHDFRQFPERKLEHTTEGARYGERN